MLGSDAIFDHERLHVFRDSATGVADAVAIHSTTLGPAMRGLRLRSYPSFGGAIEHALRLSHSMTLKNAAAGLDPGGGKAVVVDDGGWTNPYLRTRRMLAIGRVIDELGGRYITAEDVGTGPQDMDHIAQATDWGGRSW